MKVRIRYLRTPDKLSVFEQDILLEREDVIVTLLTSSDVKRTMTVNGQTILEPGAPVVWFTFPGLWHDIGRFHTRSGEFTGWYANILTPVRLLSRTEWETRDLCLDVWVSNDGDTQLLDEDEFTHAVEQGWITPHEAQCARQEAERILQAAGRGQWPPQITREWTLERASAVLRDTRTLVPGRCNERAANQKSQEQCW